MEHNKLNSLPSSISSLQSLTALYLGFNNLETIPDNVTLLDLGVFKLLQLCQLSSLQTFNIQCNHVKTFSPKIKNLKRLRYSSSFLCFYKDQWTGRCGCAITTCAGLQKILTCLTLSREWSLWGNPIAEVNEWQSCLHHLPSLSVSSTVVVRFVTFFSPLPLGKEPHSMDPH